MSALRLTVGLMLLGAAGCVVSVNDPGCACDETHACRATETCVAGQCVDPSGHSLCTGDAGFRCPDAGQGTVWSQCTDGFSRFQDAGLYDGGLALGPGNRLTAWLGAVTTPDNAGPAGIEPPSAGHVPALLPEGTLRGRVTFRALPNGIITFVAVSTPGQSFIDLYVYPLMDGRHQLQIWCGTDILYPGHVDQTVSATLGFVEVGVSYDVRARWRTGAYCQLEVDGQVVSRSEGTDAGTRPASVVDLRVGIADQDVPMGVLVPSEMTLEDWRLAKVSTDL